MTIKLLKRDLREIEGECLKAQEGIRKGRHTGYRCWLVYGNIGRKWGLTHSKGNAQPGAGVLTLYEIKVDDLEMYSLGALLDMPGRPGYDPDIYAWTAALKLRLAEAADMAAA
jgi:hypothetical protein